MAERFEGTDDYVATEDLKVAVNAAVCALASRSREEIIGRTSFDFFPEEQARAQWAADDEVLARGGVVDWSATLRSPTGRAVARPIVDPRRKASSSLGAVSGSKAGTSGASARSAPRPPPRE